MNSEGIVLGLAGAYQAVAQAQLLAQEGRVAPEIAEACLATVFRLDAEDAAAVYGGCAGVRTGLELLRAELERDGASAYLTRAVVTVLHLQGSLGRRPEVLERVRAGIEAASRSADAMGGDHDTVYERLGELYAQTLSTLRPRVMIQGNGLYLSQARVVARIRALLLAAVRSAVLWRQSGGRHWHLLLRRGWLLAGTRSLLAQSACPAPADRG